MYNIPLNIEQDFSVSVTNLVPDYSWGFNPDSILDVVSFIGQSNPSNIAVATKIKNYIRVLGATYDEYFVQLKINHPSLNGTQVEWLSVTGEIEAAGGDGYLLSTSNLNVTTNLIFSVVNIPRGSSTTRLDFKVYGKNGTDPIEYIEKESYYVKLRRLNGTDIFISPSDTIELSHIVGEALPGTVQRTVNTLTTFEVEVADHIVLSGGNLVLDSDIDGIKTYSGSGVQTINFGLEISIEAEEDTEPYYYGEVVFISSSDVVDVQGVRVYVFDSADNMITPSSLEFFAVKDFQEAELKSLSLDGYGDFTITGPSWLTFSPATGNNSTIVGVQPIASSNLSLGVYNGVLRINFFGLDHIIPVKHTVVDQLQEGFNKDEINFTKDYETITNLFGTNNSIGELNLTNVSFGYSDLITKEGSGEFKKGLFGNTTSFFIGKIIEKFMPLLRSLEKIGLDTGFVQGSGNALLPFSLYKYYNPSENGITVKLRDRDTGGYTYSKEFNGIKYIKGRRPSRFDFLFGFLDYNESPIRVTPNSYTILNMYRADNFSKINVLRNGVQYTAIYPERGDNEIFGVIFNFNKFTPGDLIELNAARNGRGPQVVFKQQYIVFPEGKESYHIGWENEHGLLDIYEFTGDIRIPKKFEGILSKEFKNYLELTKKSGSNYELNLTANTGWILKSNQERIDSLSNAKIAWLISKEGKKEIELIPIPKNLTMEVSDQWLYEYTIEFKINPQHELENNTL